MSIKVLQVGESLAINNELAGLVPMALPADQAALNEDIKTNGLQEPIVTYKGMIVDGRCRQKACLLCDERIKYKELDKDLSVEDVRQFVKSVNTRRNLTMTQKVIAGLKDYQDRKNRDLKNVSFAVVAKAWGVSDRMLKNAKYIMDKKSQYIEPLFNGETVTITMITKEGEKRVETDKISTIAKAVKMQLETIKLKVDKSKEVHWKVDSEIKTEAGKKWYAEHIEMAKQNPISYMVELANHRYSVDSIEDD